MGQQQTVEADYRVKHVRLISSTFYAAAVAACFAALGFRDLLVAVLAAAYRAGALGDAAMLRKFWVFKDGFRAVFLLPVDTGRECGIIGQGLVGWS